jgi:D-alanyl-D-alanine carboxypeptidase/D-alanyl-D-alanine-endopeptidase (penicillin-binding protein 4)
MLRLFPFFRLIPALLGATCLPGRSGEAAPAPTAALEAITLAVRQLSQDPAVSSGMVGFYLAPLERSAEPLLQQLARRSFIPASTLKTLTTGAALEILGADYQFETRLYHVPATGDLIIEGSGDPSLGRPGWGGLFDDWTTALRSAEITEITGRIIADESAWEDDELPDRWTWQDIGNYYAPVLTPLCFHDNAFRLYFRLEGKPGDPAGFHDAEPWPVNLDIVDQVRIGAPGTGDDAYVFGGPGTHRYVLRGTFAADAGRTYLRGALPDPAQTCALEFTDWLNARQIPVHGRPLTTRQSRIANYPNPVPAQGKVLVATHRSALLRDLLIPVNHRSLNLDCECLLRTLGQGRASAGIRAIRKHLAAKGLPMAGFDQADGSGLSRTNMVTPELLARANAALLTGYCGSLFLDSLPELGARGSTLGQLHASGPAVLHAKSGTIERVKGYTGLVTSAAGSRYTFAILVNNYDGSYRKSVGPGLEAVLEALSQL